jgi:negative regulator of flagellin synthesis FlgM
MSYTNGIGDLKQALSSITPGTTTAEARQVGSTKTIGSSDGAPTRELQADETRLSSTSGLIAQALNGSDVRTAKVEALQQAIASGTYQVSSSDVAGKMIDSLLD